MISPQVSGASTEDATAWLANFLRYTRLKRYPNDDVVRMFLLFLRGTAAGLHEQLTDAVRSDFDRLQQVVKKWFIPSDFTRGEKISDLFSRTQRTIESADEFVVQLQKSVKAEDMRDDTVIRCAVLKGLKPYIRSYVCSRMLRRLVVFSLVVVLWNKQCP